MLRPLRVHGHQWMFTTGIQIFLRYPRLWWHQYGVKNGSFSQVHRATMSSVRQNEFSLWRCVFILLNRINIMNHRHCFELWLVIIQCNADSVYDELMPNKAATFYNVKTNASKKKCWSVHLENLIFPNIFIFKTFHLYLHTSNICFGELLVGHKASISSLSFSMICAVVTFRRVEKVFPDRCFSLTLFWKHFFNIMKRLNCRKDALNYNRINLFDIHN